jgi:methionyl aminopeptidase
LSIPIRKEQEIESIRVSSILVANTLIYLTKHAKPGVSLIEIDRLAESYIKLNNARASFKGLYGFPSSVCTSLNSVIIHGIPDDTLLKEGDILGLDVGVEIDGWYGDAAVTIGIGSISKRDQELIDCSRDTLNFAISSIKVGMRFKELSFLIGEYIKKKGYLPLKNYCGHGIGKKPHEEPEILNYLDSPNAKQGPKIKDGMVFCLEPMICQEESTPLLLEDKWSVVSSDRKNGSHYEHTIAIIDGSAHILSQEG